MMLREARSPPKIQSASVLACARCSLLGLNHQGLYPSQNWLAQKYICIKPSYRSAKKNPAGATAVQLQGLRPRTCTQLPTFLLYRRRLWLQMEARAQHMVRNSCPSKASAAFYSCEHSTHSHEILVDRCCLTIFLWIWHFHVACKGRKWGLFYQSCPWSNVYIKVWLDFKLKSCMLN